ncbi:MAG TPA: thioredoxin [Candidatus Limnocylindrales bacterium]|nr:thioredoxin [Candidatus Limnocylindrales bacterium]
MSNEEMEIQRIKEKKLVEMMQKARAQLETAARNDGKPILLSDVSFSSEISKYPLMVVDFWAAWCGPCRMVAPIIEQLAKEYAGRVAFGKLNVDENPLTSGEFEVQSIPTLLIFRNGEAVDGIVGAVPKYQIESRIKAHLGN